MNEDTRIAVCCYAGDQHQVIKALGAYLHHKRPVVVLSPEDSKAEIRYSGIENRFAGKRAYIGQDSLDRQREHLEVLLTFPEKYFLVHDADSVCLTPKLPRYLYEDHIMLWSNVVNDGIPGRDNAYPDGYPRIAFQPPYFMTRRTIEVLLSAARKIRANPTLPFIDHYMLQLAMESRCPYRTFRDGASCPIDRVKWPTEFQLIADAVRHRGAIFLHSIKDVDTLHALGHLRKEYEREHPNES